MEVLLQLSTTESGETELVTLKLVTENSGVKYSTYNDLESQTPFTDLAVSNNEESVLNLSVFSSIE